MMGSDNESVPEPMDISDLNTDGKLGLLAVSLNTLQFMISARNKGHGMAWARVSQCYDSYERGTIYDA